MPTKDSQPLMQAPQHFILPKANRLLVGRWVCAIALLLATATVCSAQIFTDGFEEPTLNPFWTIASGSAAPTTSFPHTGSQSMQAQWNTNVQHSFGSQQTGTVSVWMLGSQLCCGASADIEILPYLGDAIPGEPYRWVALVVGGGQASFRQSSGGPYTVTNFPADLTQWHHLEVHVGAAGAIAVFDGTIVGHEPSVTSFGAINFSVWGGGSSSPAYFDDFMADVAPVALYNVCLLYDSTKAAKSGSTIPVKLQLCDSSGNDLSSPTVTLHAFSITMESSTISGAVQDSGNANPDNDFRFDPSLGPTGGYIFNLSTRGLSTGSYRLNFTVSGDPTVHGAPFQVK